MLRIRFVNLIRVNLFLFIQISCCFLGLSAQSISFNEFDSLAYKNSDSALVYLNTIDVSRFTPIERLDYQLKESYALMRKSEISRSAELLYEGLQDSAIHAEPLLKSRYYRVLGINQYLNHQPNEAFQSFYRCLSLLHLQDDNETRAAIYHSLGSMYIEENRLDSADYYLKRAIQIREKYAETSRIFLMLSYRVYASFLAAQKKYDEAAKILDLILNDALKTNDVLLEASAFINMIELPNLSWSNEELIRRIDSIVEKISLTNSENAKQYTYAISSRILSQRGLYKKAFQLLGMANAMDKQMHAKSLETAIAEKQVEYETALINAEKLALQQKSEIQDLQLRQNRQEKLGLVFILIMICSAALLYVYRLKIKQENLNFQYELEAQRIQTQSLLDGEEQEKRRVSMELHDGVAQMLAGVHFYLQALKTRSTFDPSLVETASDLLSKSVHEVRAVSHSLSVSKWVNLSLEEALIEIKKFSSDVPISILCSQNNVEFLSSDQKLGLIRILQECIKNSTRHGKATEIRILCEVLLENQLRIKYSENGIAFNPFERNESKGIGLKNIQTRMKFLGIESSYTRENDWNYYSFTIQKMI